MNINLHKRRMQWIAGILILAVIGVLGRLYYFQVVKFSEYQLEAIRQQTRETSISPNRGMIYDRNMRILASSSAVERVFISPAELNIKSKANGEYEPDEETEKMRKEKAAVLVSEYFSALFGLDYDWVYERTQRANRRDETIKPKVDIIIANQVRQFAADNRIAGIYFAQETRRVYPYSNLAAHVIGFTGAENNGLLGIEAKYNEYLRGVAGRIVTARDAKNNLMSSEYETYIDAKNGSNIVLTIDWTIQNFLERHIETAFAESQAAQRVLGVIMDVHTGEILALVIKPDFDLNEPLKWDDEVMKYINLDWADNQAVERDLRRLEAERDNGFDEEERESERERLIRLTKLNKLWKNKVITEPYEPGSTFKVITAAMALEEKAVGEHDRFYCGGVLMIGGHDIHCHVRHGHGSLTFAEGLKVSCNPVTMATAERITAPVFLKYFEAFGYNEKTGIDLPGETVGLTHRQMGSVELATSSFGQTFNITPIQHLVALAAVANGGKILTPRVVKSIIDDSGNIIKNFEPEIKRTILSGETTKIISRILAEGVADRERGGARNAFVKGYQVAAKTGTSQKRGAHDDPEARIGSTVAYAPADNPQIVMLIIVDEPDLRVSSMFGGVIAAPYIARTLADTLPYLGIEPQYTAEEIAELQVLVRGYALQKVDVSVEDIVSRGLEYHIEGSGEFVRVQIPRQGSRLRKGGRIILYTGDSSPEDNLIIVPDVLSVAAETADRRLNEAGLNINIVGAAGRNSGAAAYKQSPEAGERVPKGTIVTVEFMHQDSTE